MFFGIVTSNGISINLRHSALSSSAARGRKFATSHSVNAGKNSTSGLYSVLTHSGSCPVIHFNNPPASLDPSSVSIELTNRFPARRTRSLRGPPLLCCWRNDSKFALAA